MDSATEDSRNADRAGDVDVDDLISGLNDDVLLHILELVADGTDAARMGAVSRRWLGLWARVPALRFACRPPVVSTTATATERRAALTRYVSFVNGVLARRSSSAQSGCAAIESLAISCTLGSEQLEQLIMPALIDAAQGWIRYVSQQGVKRFILDLDCHEVRREFAGNKQGWKKELVVVLLDELARPPRLLETMRLALGGVRLQLPAATAMEFASLRDLSLERITIADGGGHLLACLVSSASCPRLQKLRLNKVWLSDYFKEELRLQADVLSELWMEEVHSVSLELRTPSLRVLHIGKCFHKAIRIAAPRLEQLALFFRLGWTPGCLEIDGDSPPCMRRLKLSLWSHRCHDNHYGEAENHSNTLLLNHYSSITCFDVTLYGRKVHLISQDHIYISHKHGY